MKDLNPIDFFNSLNIKLTDDQQKELIRRLDVEWKSRKEEQPNIISKLRSNLIDEARLNPNLSIEERLKYLILIKCSMGNDSYFYPGRGGIIEKDMLEFIPMFVESGHLIEELGHWNSNYDWEPLDQDQLKEYMNDGMCVDQNGWDVIVRIAYKVGPQALKEWEGIAKNQK